MPIRLSPEELAFVERVHAYCGEGLTQPQMAEREGVSLTAVRDRLRRCGFEFQQRTQRDLVRTRTSETFAQMRAAGQIVTEEPQTAGAA